MESLTQISSEKEKGGVLERSERLSERDRGGERGAKQRITMASLPESSCVANAKLPHAGRHMRAHIYGHAHRQFTQAR